MQQFILNDTVFWYLDHTPTPPLTMPLNVDVVVVGGGMAGLTAAQCFRQRGLSVALLEKNYCGSGATGKSSGFITPDSEINLSHYIRYYGQQRAHEIWQLGMSGVNHIKDNIKTFSLDCDYQEQDTLIVAYTRRAFKNTIQHEAEVRKQLGYSSTVYSAQEVPNILGSSAFYGGIKYGQTFGIHAYRYCQAMKDVLINSGVQVYENTPALSIEKDIVQTPYTQVKARYIVTCLDRFLPDLHMLPSDIYHVQTFLMISDPLSQQQIKTLFPDGPCMVWDTDLVYTYFRLTGDNRLLLGGGDVFSTYDRIENHHSLAMAKKLMRYFKKKFPRLQNVNFEYMWPGLIGISKDIVPIAGFDKNNDSLYYVTACTGLPWAAALGNYCVKAILDNNTEFKDLFSPYRFSKSGHLFQSVFGKRISFALSNFAALYLR